MDNVEDWLTENNIPHFITGSVRFECATDISDLDICVCINNKEKIVNALSGSKISESNYNAGIKVSVNGAEINFIFLRPVDYCAWSKVAKMSDATGVLKIVQKEKRYYIHEILVSATKLSFSNFIGIENYQQYA